MYNKDDILTNTIVNNLYERLNSIVATITSKNYLPELTHGRVNKNSYEPLYIEEVELIENLIHDIGFSYFQPNGWQETKIWENGNRSFSYQDINRWVNNITLLEENEETTDELYNKTSFYIYEWDVETNMEWS